MCGDVRPIGNESATQPLDAGAAVTLEIATVAEVHTAAGSASLDLTVKAHRVLAGTRRCSRVRSSRTSSCSMTATGPNDHATGVLRGTAAAPFDPVAEKRVAVAVAIVADPAASNPEIARRIGGGVDHTTVVSAEEFRDWLGSLPAADEGRCRCTTSAPGRTLPRR